MWNVDAFFQTPGVGGAVACAVIVTLVACYALTIRWISKGHEEDVESRSP